MCVDELITKLIPHRPPFVLLDRLTRCQTDAAEGEVCFAADHWAVRGGRIPAGIIIESLGQLAAAMDGRHAKEAGGQTSRGMLVAVRGFHFEREARVGMPILLKIEIHRRLSPFVLAQAAAMQDDCVLAQGQLRFFVERNTTQTS